MPLHDWTEPAGWDSVHHLWLTYIFFWVRTRLPPDYRAYVGSAPGLAIEGVTERPDVAVRHWLPDSPSSPPPEISPSSTSDEQYVEVATIRIDPQKAVYVTYRGRMVAAVELISPRNKDRPSAREHYLARYLGYLLEGVNLLLVDVHPRPLNFSFADALAQELAVPQDPLPPPLAVTYRLGGPAATGGMVVGIWPDRLKVGASLPTKKLPLTVHTAIPVDLESTYNQAAADAYLT